MTCPVFCAQKSRANWVQPTHPRQPLTERQSCKLRWTASLAGPACKIKPQSITMPDPQTLPLAPGMSSTPRPLPVSPAAAGGWTIAGDGWVHLMTYGELPGTLRLGDERKPFVQICDREAAVAIAQHFSGEELVDYEHKSIADDETSDTSAAGWIDNVDVRDDGLYGHVRWSAKGRTDIEGGNYRHISPVLAGLIDLGNGKMRPTKLIGAGLTNKPNFKDLTPVSNREAANQTNIMDYKTILTKLLGLADTATDEDITKAVDTANTKLKAAGATNPAEAADNAVAANREIDTLRADLAAADLAARGIKPDHKAYQPLAKAIVANRTDGLAMADAIATAASGSRYETVTNREPARTPTGLAANKAAKQDAEVRAYMTANKCSYAQAFDAVRNSKPELFSAE